MNVNNAKPYDMLIGIVTLLMQMKMETHLWSIQKDYGKTILWVMHVLMAGQLLLLCNQRLMVKTIKRRIAMNGVIYNDSADKAARFILNCNQKENSLFFCRMLQVL